MFSKAARWSSSHKYIQAIVFSKGSYSIGLNSSLLYQITFHRTRSLLITRDISGCFLGRGGRGVIFKLHFCGACLQNPPYHCLGLCLLMFFWARASRDAGQSLPLWFFGHAFSHTAFQTDLLTYTHCGVFFLSLPLSLYPLLCFLSQRAAYHKITGCHI